MREGHEPPDHGEQKPAAQERHGEDHKCEAPFQVHESGEHVLQKATLLADVLVRQVAGAALGDEAGFVDPVSEHGFAVNPRCEARNAKLLRDYTLSCQHPLYISAHLRWKLKVVPSLCVVRNSVTFAGP